MYSDETPILESVFVALAPNAESIHSVVNYWPLVPLTYGELSDWTDEIAAGMSTVLEHAGIGIA